jgi:hypothetical protein
MRKLLLATVAALGASMGFAAYADAQVVDNSTDGQSYPTPGTVTVRLNGRFRQYAYVADNGAVRTTNYGVTGVNGTTTGSGAAVGATAATGGVNQQGSNRLSNYGFEGYARLYPGFDGVAANGLKYGASLEIRQDNAFGAGGGTDGSISSSNRSRGALYLRREWGYIGTDKFGSVRFGSADQPSSLFLTGTGENFDDGGLNGDVPGFLANGGAYAYPFADVGNLYSTDKLVYLSPQFYGVDFGLSYEPSTAAIGNDNGAGCGGNGNPASGNSLATSPGASTAAPGCDALNSTSTTDIARRKDTYEGLVRYRGTFGAFGVVGTASYDGSGRVHDSGVLGSSIDPKHVRNEDLSVYDFGLAVTYGGLTVSGNYQRGRYNVQGGGGFGGLVTKGQPDSNAYVGSVSYTVGPLIVGASFSESWYEGNQTAATNASSIAGGASPLTVGGVTGGQRRDTGLAVGGTYSLAPGVALYLSGVWEEARQRGVNLVTGGSNVGLATDVHNKLDQSVLAFGTSFAW